MSTLYYQKLNTLKKRTHLKGKILRNSGIPAILACCIFYFSSCTQNKSSREKNKPSIVFILVDDLDWTDLSCYGSDLYETPNIDQLAAQSVRFTQAYASAPACSPTRASIMAGKYPPSLNFTEHLRLYPYQSKPEDQLIPPNIIDNMPPEETTIAEILSSAGYTTAHIGKWHFPHYSNMEGSKPVGAIRKGNYKLLEFYEDNRLELYNLKDDLNERHNLAQTNPEIA